MKHLYLNYFRSITIYGLFFLSLTEMLIGLPALAQITRYVSTTGTNANPVSATSWATSTTNLQGAIDASASGDLVWGANGTYKPGGNGHSNRDLSFAMKNGVAIYGGFAGTETTLDQRPAITVSTPSGTTLSGDVGILNNPTDNSFHVFNNPAGLTNTAILNGFVIVGGYTSGASPETYGGGMYNKAISAGQVCSPHIINCLFDSNIGSEGGGMYNNGSGGGISNPKLTNCVFRNNVATGVGGAILNDGGGNGTCNPVFTNCLFDANTARDGGAIYNYGQSGTCSPQFINCTLRNNSATLAAGGMYNTGFDGLCLPTITNCILFGNGGANTFANISTTGASASYSLFEPSVTGYASLTGNLTTTLSPFVSVSSVQLKNGSPAVNAGDPATTTATVGSTDLAGNPRFFAHAGTPAGRIDMGAYELQEILELYSLADGSWSDPSVWSVARLPQLNERVRLKHLITIPASYLALGGMLIYDPASKLIYSSGGRLQMGQ